MDRYRGRLRRIAILLGVLCAVPLINRFIIRLNWPLWGDAFYSVADTLAAGCLLALLKDRLAPPDHGVAMVAVAARGRGLCLYADRVSNG